MRQRPYRPKPWQQLNIAGNKYGSFTVLKMLPITGKKTDWLCRCDCGKEVVKVGSELRRKKRPLFGCGMECPFTKEAQSKPKTHGMSKHPAHCCWAAMKARCSNPKHKAWHNYGGRGISVCGEWEDSFEQFWVDMGSTYQKGLDIDREDNNGNYTPKNCRWVTRRKNTRNRRVTIRLPGFPPDFWDVALAKGIKRSTLYYRIKAGLSWEQIINTPLDFRNKFTTSEIVVRGTDLQLEAELDTY